MCGYANNVIMQYEEGIAVGYKSENIFTGKKIRSYRTKKKWMQSDLAEKIGVKGNTISAYERGAVEIPQSKLKALADALEVKTSDLLPIDEESQDELSGYIQEAKSRLDEDQMKFFELLLKKSLSLEESDREHFFKNVRMAVKFFDEDKK